MNSQSHYKPLPSFGTFRRIQCDNNWNSFTLETLEKLWSLRKEGRNVTFKDLHSFYCMSGQNSADFTKKMMTFQRRLKTIVLSSWNISVLLCIFFCNSNSKATGASNSCTSTLRKTRVKSPKSEGSCSLSAVVLSLCGLMGVDLLHNHPTLLWLCVCFTATQCFSHSLPPTTSPLTDLLWFDD